MRHGFSVAPAAARASGSPGVEARTGGRFRFRQDEYVESLRMRLLVDPFPSPGARRCTTCDRDVRYADAPLHALECSGQERAMKRRHGRQGGGLLIHSTSTRASHGRVAHGA